MANVFSLTDGTTTIQLNSGDILTESYPIAEPGIDLQEIAGTESGGTVVNAPLRNVTESIDVVLTNNARSNLNVIERMFDLARQRQRDNAGPRVYIQVSIDEANTWRSEVLAGRVSLEHAPDQLWRNRVRATLHITRRYYWEGPETQLKLTSSANSTPTTSPVTLYNNDDATATQTNWIGIASSQVTGVLPAPIKLKLTNAELSALNYSEFFIANNVFSDPTGMDPFLLGTEAAGGATFSWSSSSQVTAYTWDLASTLLADTAGRYFRVLAAFSSASTGVYLQPVVLFGVGGLYIDIYVGGEVYHNGEELVDLGAVPLPPGGYNPNTATVALAIRARKSGGGSLTLDFVQLTPTGHGIYRRVRQLGFAMESNDALVDDGIEGLVYGEEPDSDRLPVMRGLNAPIHVWPNRTQRLRVLARESSGFVAGRKFTAQIWYRPRRLVL